MVKLTLKFENLKEKIPSNQRKRLYRCSKKAKKFILSTQEDIDYEKILHASHETVGLTFGESLNLIESLLIKLSEDYPDDPEFLDKIREMFHAWFEDIARVRLSS